MLSRALRPALIGLTLWTVAAAASPWPHEQSDLLPDPAVVWGRLDNGLRYAIRPNAEPKGSASLRLLVFAGSLHETEAQRGFAHFVEHMAFNGTRLYPKETLVGVLQKLGLAFGADLTAETTQTHTIYKLGLPGAQPERLGEGLTVLREFADGVTFDPAEVERERSVIESERTARDTEALRAGEAFRRFMFPGSPLGERSPIGLPEVIRHAEPAELRAFYNQWYRADNMLVVAVGDFDAAAVEAQLRERFASLSTPATPTPAFDVPIPPNPPEMTAGCFRDEDRKGAVSVHVFSLTSQANIDNRSRRLANIVRRVAFHALALRLQSARLREGSRFGVMNASLDNSSRLYQQADLRVDTNGKRWRDAVNRAEQELRRALTHGFTTAEIREVNIRRLADAEYRARAASTRTSSQLADEIADCGLNHLVFATPETNLELVREGLAVATPAACLAAFRAAWSEGQPRIFISGSLPKGIGPPQAAAAARESMRKRVDPAVETAVAGFAYTDFGPPGVVAKRTHIDDLDIHCVEFANGVKLNLKATDFSADRILFSARFGTGWAGEPANRPGLRMVMGHGFTALGLGRHKREALNRLSAGVIATFKVGLDEDAFTADGSTDGAGAARWMQLLTASLNDPGWHKEELREIRQRIIFRFTQHAEDGTEVLAGYFYRQLTGQDPRYSWPETKRVLRYSVADLRAWVEPQLKSGPLEIGIVGDFDVEEMIELAARTVGCLPPRSHPPPVAPVKFATVHNPKPLPVKGTIRSGAVMVGWALPAAHGHADLRRDQMLAEILQNRLIARIREEMGATYAPACGVWRSEVQPDNAYLTALLTCAPGDTQRVAEAIRQVADELARGRVSEEEFERARQPQIQAIPAQRLSNAYWLHSVVLKAQSRPEELELPRTELPDLEQMTAADIMAHSAMVLPAAHASVFTAVPKPQKKP